MMVIRKYNKPRCFRDFNILSFSNYRATKKFWMVSEILKSWFYDVIYYYRGENKDVALKLGNSPGHKIVVKCCNVQLISRPPNLTGLLNLWMHRKHKGFKIKYKKFLLGKILIEYK